ncbi:MAG: hypothetical protein AAFV07_06565 [Bacteroidota bacterium]
MKTFFAFLLALLTGLIFPVHLQAQQEKKPLSSGLQFGVHNTNRGFGFELGFLKGPNSRQFVYGIDLHLVRDQQETRSESFFQNQGRRYVFGKLNNFLVLHPSIGVQTEIVPRTFISLVKMKVGAKIGPAIGLLNPYYLEIFEPNPTNPVSGARSIAAYDPAEHTYGLIIGRANLISSQIDLKARIGLSTKAYALFNFARKARYISALKLAVHADAFTNSVPILVATEQLPQRRFFLAFSVGLLFGSRW